TSTGTSDLKVYNGQDYFLVEQQINLDDMGGLKLYNASFQYVLYKNGSMLMNYDFVTINFPVTESIGLNFGDGNYYTPYQFSTDITHKSLRFDYGFANSTRIANYSVSPASGSQVTAFNFTLVYQNLENRAPYTITLTFDNQNYTMNAVAPADKIFVDGKNYSLVFQFLAPGIPHNNSFHVTGPDGDWHSPLFTTPVVTYNNSHTPTIEAFSMEPAQAQQGYSNFSNVSIQFTYKDLDNDAPANVSLVFNASNVMHTFSAQKKNVNDSLYFDGCQYRLYLNSTNTTFLYSAWSAYAVANDSSNAVRYPGNLSQWIQGPSWVVPMNYSASKVYIFESYDLTSPTEIIAMRSIDLPFSFPFYGILYNKLVFSYDGFIRFTDNMASTLPVPGSTNLTSRLSINLLGEKFYFWTSYPYSTIEYQAFPDKIVFDFYNIWYRNPPVNGTSYHLGDFQLILHINGDIVFSFFDLRHVVPGGVNLGNGIHYTFLPATQQDAPMTNCTFKFSPLRVNLGVETSAIYTLPLIFNSTQQIPFKVQYKSPANVPVVKAYYIVEGKDFHGTVYAPITGVLAFEYGNFVNYTTGARLTLNRDLPSGVYNITYRLLDIYQTQFFTVPFQITVNDPPIYAVANTLPAYSSVGRNFTIMLTYSDNESVEPEYFRIQWDGINYTLAPSTTNFSTTVLYSITFNLTHGTHVYSVFLKDKYRLEEQHVFTSKTIIVKYLPIITILVAPPANIYAPGTFQVKVRITSQETSFSLLSKKIFVDYVTSFQLNEDFSSGNSMYIADVYLGEGNHVLTIVISDGYNTVSMEIATVTVINLPLILSIIISASVAATIVAVVQIRKNKVKYTQTQQLKKQILAKKPARREIEETAEVKRKERQKEVDETGAVDTIQATASAVKKSAAVKKATGAAPAQKEAPLKVARPKPAAASHAQPKDKSKFAPKPTDSGTIINRTILKEYIERMRKAGEKELHYIKIKNDLNIISQNKSSKLYRLLQELVSDNILVRKGSNYIIVG
nr:hypothetical protein [Candidatus Sigynarchaeota archaeon]